jgi:hypothetical protein
MIKAFIHEDDEDELIANTYVMGKPGGSCLVVDLGDPLIRSSILSRLIIRRFLLFF